MSVFDESPGGTARTGLRFSTDLNRSLERLLTEHGEKFLLLLNSVLERILRIGGQLCLELPDSVHRDATLLYHPARSAFFLVLQAAVDHDSG